MYLLVTPSAPEEKMALFLAHVLATGNSKVDNYAQLLEPIAISAQLGWAITATAASRQDPPR